MICTIENITREEFEVLWEHTEEYTIGVPAVALGGEIWIDGVRYCDTTRVEIKEKLWISASDNPGFLIREEPEGLPLLFITGEIINNIFNGGLLLMGKNSNNSMMWVYRDLCKTTNQERVELCRTAKNIKGLSVTIHNGEMGTLNFVKALGGVSDNPTEEYPRYDIRWGV
jgi:hypothetical protein